MAPNSKLSSNSHTSSLPRPEQPAQQQDCLRQSQRTPRQARAPSQQELLSQCRCSSCRAGSGPVTPIHGVPRCRNHLPSRPPACDNLPQPLVPGFRFRRQIWEEQTKQCQDSLLRQLPGSHHCSFLPPLPVPSALLSRSCQQDFPSSTPGCLRPSAPMTGPWLPFSASASRDFCCRAGWLR